MEYTVLVDCLKKNIVWIAGGLVLIIGGFFYFSDSKVTSSKPAPLVKVAEISKGDRIERLHLTGTVVAPESVTVKSRLDSQIIKIYIMNGQAVKKGDKLVQLDDRTLKALLAQAKANLESNKAELIRSEKKYNRDIELTKRGVAAKETLDQSTQTYLTAKAGLEATQAQIVNLETQIDYADIRSPIDGYAGTISLTEGNLVKANDTNSIVVINKTNPINVDIPLPQRYYASLKSEFNKINITVKASDTSREKKAKGVIIENTVDTTSRTLILRAEFENADKSLWPGMFVDVVLDLKTYKDALVVPLKAIFHTQNNQQVFVVPDDQIAHLHPVTVLFTTETEAIIDAKLKPGDHVITDGGFNVKPDSKVTVVKDTPQ